MNFIQTGISILLLSFTIQALELEMDLNSNQDPLTSAVFNAVSQAFDLNKKGIEFLNKGKLDTAMACFQKALDIVPEYSDAENNIGVVYYRKGDIAEAKNTWEELASKDPEYGTALYNLGLLNIHDHHLDLAERFLIRAIKAQKTLVEAYVRLGYVYLVQEQNDKALEQFRKAYKMAPNNQDAWSFMAHGLIQIGDTNQALSILKQHDGAAPALRMTGLIAEVRGDYAKATEYLSKAVAKGADPSVLVDLASSQIESNNCKGAQCALKEYFDKTSPYSADAFLLAGLAAKECGDLKGSLQYFEKGLKQYPADPILRYNLGQLYFFQKQYDNAEKTWTDLKDSLQDPSLYYLRALNARRLGDLAAAEQYVNLAMDADERAEYHDFLGIVLFEKGDKKGAEESFRKALKLDPEMNAAQLHLALLSSSKNDLAAAEATLTGMLSSCKDDSCADIALRLSVIYYNQKDFQRAVDVLLSIKDSDRDEKVYRYLALYYRELQLWDKSIAALETAVKRFVVDPKTECDLAESYLIAGRYSKAIERFTGLLQKWASNPWRLYYQLGYAYMEMNEFEKAKTCFEKSITSKKDNTAARALLAFVYNRQGDVFKARELWQKTLSDDPNNPVLWINMGLSYERDGDYQNALLHYQKAAALKSDDPAIKINIGNAYAGLEEYSDAVHYYSQALSSPKKELAAYDILLVSLKKKEIDRAQKMLDILQKEFQGTPTTLRAEAEMALVGGDTARAITTLESLKEKEPADYYALARIYAIKGTTEKTERCLSYLTDQQWDKPKKTIEAQLAYNAGNYSKATELLEQSGDTSFAAQYNRALSAYQNKRFDETVRIANQIVRSATGNDRADVLKLAGNACFALKRWGDAKAWYLQLSTLEARNPIVQYNLAVAAYNLGNMDESWEYYQRAKELDASIYNKDIETRYAVTKGKGQSGGEAIIDTVDLLYNKAVELQEQGKDTAAEGIYMDVVKRNPTHSQAWNNLGAIYGKWGQVDNAINAYQKAVEKKHDIPETYANLVNMYLELEQFKDARKWLIKGIGHNPDSDMLKELQAKISEAESKTGKN